MTPPLTVRELRDLIDGLDDATVVRIAKQPSYPLICEVAGLAHREEERVYPSEADVDAATVGVVYLLEGEDSGYGDRDLWNI